MQNHSENTKRLAKNTLMLYGRIVFGWSRNNKIKKDI